MRLAEADFIQVDAIRDRQFLQVEHRSGPDFADVQLGDWRVSPVVYFSSWAGVESFPVPVKVELEVGEDGFMAFSPTLEVGGVGESPAAAIYDLMGAARELYRELRSTPDEELHRSARVSLERLHKFFR